MFTGTAIDIVIDFLSDFDHSKRKIFVYKCFVFTGTAIDIVIDDWLMHCILSIVFFSGQDHFCSG